MTATPAPACPYCAASVSLRDAAAVRRTRPQQIDCDIYRCPSCAAEIRKVVPIFKTGRGGWLWMPVPG